MGQTESRVAIRRRLEKNPFLQKLGNKQESTFWEKEAQDGFLSLSRITKENIYLALVDPQTLEEGMFKSSALICRNDLKTNSIASMFQIVIDLLSGQKVDSLVQKDSLMSLVNVLVVLKIVLNHLLSRLSSERNHVVLERHFPKNLLKSFVREALTFMGSVKIDDDNFFVVLELVNVFIVLFSTTLYGGIKKESSGSSSDVADGNGNPYDGDIEGETPKSPRKLGGVGGKSDGEEEDFDDESEIVKVSSLLRRNHIFLESCIKVTDVNLVKKFVFKMLAKITSLHIIHRSKVLAEENRGIFSRFATFISSLPLSAYHKMFGEDPVQKHISDMFLNWIFPKHFVIRRKR